MEAKKTAYYHLPGLFEFCELYRAFLPLFFEHRDWFYDWCEIGSIYGSPADCLWNGGRVGCGENRPEEVLRLTEKYGISARLTFSNSRLTEAHLQDRKCNALCKRFSETDVPSGVILYSDLLLKYLQERYPSLYFVSSTTKVLTAFEDLKRETERSEFRFVVPDFRLNHALSDLQTLSEKDKVEFLVNECCWVGCKDRSACYENVSRKNLGEDCPDHVCRAPDAKSGYKFSKAMESPAFIGTEEITDVFLPMGFSNFKIEGRSLGSALILEFLLYYLTKPAFRLRVREEIYLDGTLDLF